MTAERSLKLAGEEHRRDAWATDAVSAWLRVLEPLLKLPEAERRAIVDELESHLRERVREQLIAGMAEGDAVRGAIGELGDAAELAQRFRAAGRTPTRRLVMNVALIGMAGAALVTSVVAVTRGVHAPAVSVYQPEPARMKADAKAPAGKPLADVKLEKTPLIDALSYLAQMANLTLHARWDRLGEAGVEKQEPVTVVAKNADLDRMFDLLNEGRGGDLMDFRVHDGMLEVAPRRYFDRREAELVSFDISGVIGHGASADELLHAIASLVEPDNWTANGGDTGELHVVGKRLFVKAPARMWKKAAWIIQQLSPEAEAKPEHGAADGKVPVLSDIPIIDHFFIGDASRVPGDAELARGREFVRLKIEAAWAKEMLGRDLTDQDRVMITMGPDRQVKRLQKGQPAYAEKEKELEGLEGRLRELEPAVRGDKAVLNHLTAELVSARNDLRALEAKGLGPGDAAVKQASERVNALEEQVKTRADALSR